MNFIWFVKGTMLKYCAASYHISCIYIFFSFPLQQILHECWTWHRIELFQSWICQKENVSELRSFFISNQFWTAENLKPLSVFNIATKNRNKKDARTPFFFCFKTVFLPPKSSFLHFVQAFGAQKSRLFDSIRFGRVRRHRSLTYFVTSQKSFRIFRTW